MAQLKNGFVVYMPDTRGVEVSRYGKGNLKIGANVYTYSRPAGDYQKGNAFGTCPGSTSECEAICYAKRIAGPVFDNYRRNTGADVPPIPDDAKVMRLHVSGDFDSVAYIENWTVRLAERPDVTMWAYTRSWRVATLLPALERLRALPNVQLFASMDESCPDLPPSGWRRAWIDGDTRAGDVLDVAAHTDYTGARNQRTFDGAASLVCPEETKHKADCEACGYCFAGKRNDVTFLRH